MCGPTKDAKSLNDRIQQFSGQVQQQATEVFGKDSQVFNDLMTSYGKLIAGGPNQHGMNEAELSAERAQVIDQSATSYKNIKSAVGNAVAAIGGGNEVSPSGLETSVNTQAAVATEMGKNAALRDITARDYGIGRDNYFRGLEGESRAPSVFNGAAEFDKTAQEGLNQAQTSQKNIDAQKGWWKSAVMGAVGAGASFISGGLSNLGAGESFGEGVGDFFKGGLGSLGGG